ncbi:MAG: hypothetical protein KDA29_00545 [Phycisphaerales bacterium]|nr:hypothetical protein [Phycisphaerales bacterium]
MKSFPSPKVLTTGVCALIGLGLWTVGGCRHQSLGIRDEATHLRTPYFPRISSENLNKEPITLPDDLKGQPALLLIAYRQHQQENVNTWLGHLDTIEEQIPGVRVLELPTISSRSWGWMAGFIDGGMRSGIPDPAARARTVTLYTDVSLFNQALMIEETDTIHAVLLDQDSRVIARVDGDYDEAKLQTLIDALP